MIQVLLLGDSLVAFNNWQNQIAPCQVTNLGMPGAMTSDVADSLDDVKDQHPHADVIMLIAGTNDILTGNFEFIDTLRIICVTLRKNYPGAEILITSILPMDLPHLSHSTISSLNCHIEALTIQTGCCYFDIHSRLKNISVPIFEDDGVHVTKKTYEIWSRTLLEHIAFLIEND